MPTQKKLRVVVVMGGKSPEYNVSIASGIQIIKNLSSQKYEITPIIISPDGKTWHITSPVPILSLPNPLDPGVKSEDLIPTIRKSVGGLSSIQTPIDVVFIAMHGPGGEDGVIQGMLELAGVAYTGSGVLASAIGMDKLMFRQLMASHKILTPKYVAIKKQNKISLVVKYLGKPPYFVKPSNQGSSVGNSIVEEKRELKKALNLAWKYSDIALVDQYIKGREFTVAVLGGKKPKTLPIIEIITNRGFFDYQAKYQNEETQEIVPAKIDRKTTKRIQRVAMQVFQSLNCKGVARVDFLLKGEKLYVLEINTIPGMTENSLVPKAAKEAGISYPQLLDTIIKDASH